MKWAQHQPKDGETILVCGHEEAQHYHWYGLDVDEQGVPHQLPFRCPDGSSGASRWLCICEACEADFGSWLATNPGGTMNGFLQTERSPVRGERTWIGDEPFIPAPQ